jgi:hypothetical protein
MVCAIMYPSLYYTYKSRHILLACLELFYTETTQVVTLFLKEQTSLTRTVHFQEVSFFESFAIYVGSHLTLGV